MWHTCMCFERAAYMYYVASNLSHCISCSVQNEFHTLYIFSKWTHLCQNPSIRSMGSCNLLHNFLNFIQCKNLAKIQYLLQTASSLTPNHALLELDHSWSCLSWCALGIFLTWRINFTGASLSLLCL